MRPAKRTTADLARWYGLAVVRVEADADGEAPTNHLPADGAAAENAENRLAAAEARLDIVPPDPLEDELAPGDPRCWWLNRDDGHVAPPGDLDDEEFAPDPETEGGDAA